MNDQSKESSFRVVNSLRSMLLISKSKLLRSQGWLSKPDMERSAGFQAESVSGKRMKSPMLGACAASIGVPVHDGLGFCREGDEVLVVAADAPEDPWPELL